MKERIPKKRGAPEVTRRGFLGRVVSHGLNLTIAGQGAAVYFLHEQKKIDEGKRLATREGGFEVSKTFAKHIEEHEVEFEKTHMSGVEKFGEKVAIDAQGRTRIGEVRENFMNESVTGLPNALREELAYLGPGLPAKESSYNNASISYKTNSKGEYVLDAEGKKIPVAVRIFQFKPDTYKELGYTDDTDNPNPKETDFSLLKNQIECANKFFVREYKNLVKDMAPVLSLIEKTYFPGNKERFERQFLPLVMLSVYHAGPDRVRRALTWFADQPVVDAQGYDVYEAMSSRLKEENAETKGSSNDAVPGYGEHSSSYAQKVFAFARLIEKAIGDGRIQLAVR